MSEHLSESLRVFLDAEEAPAGFETDESIDAFLDMLEERFADATAVEPSAQRIENVQHAEWAARKVAGLDQQLRTVTAYEVDAIDRIERWAEAQRKPLSRRRQWLVNLLLDYGRRVVEAEVADKGKRARKSVELPSGTITSSSTRPKFVITDGEAIVDFAETGGVGYSALIRTKVEPAKSEWSDLVGFVDGRVVFLPTGEPIPGVYFDPGGVRTYDVKIDPLD